MQKPFTLTMYKKEIKKVTESNTKDNMSLFLMTLTDPIEFEGQQISKMQLWLPKDSFEKLKIKVKKDSIQGQLRWDFVHNEYLIDSNFLNRFLDKFSTKKVKITVEET